jgi:transcriptional regulator with GAF, ATPase, and Fis domain
MMKCVAGTDATVLVTGETGTGKEAIARLIHTLSGRKNKALVKLDCTTIPANTALAGHWEPGLSADTPTRMISMRPR